MGFLKSNLINQVGLLKPWCTIVFGENVTCIKLIPIRTSNILINLVPMVFMVVCILYTATTYFIKYWWGETNRFQMGRAAPQKLKDTSSNPTHAQCRINTKLSHKCPRILEVDICCMAGFWGEVRTSPEIVLHRPWEFCTSPEKSCTSRWESFNDGSKWKIYIFWLLRVNTS